MGLREGIVEQLHPQVRTYIQELESSSRQRQQRLDELEARYEHLKEEYRLLVYKRFARSSEQLDESQAELFAESEENAEKSGTEKEITVAGHIRKRRGRKPLDEKLPRVETVHDIIEEEKQCACGHELTRIGEEISERLQVIPEQIWVERHIRPKYACKHCEGSGDEENPAVRVAPAAASILPGSILTPGLLAFILVNKFVDHLPFYRQEQRFERLGIHISRQDMSNWTIAAANRIGPLVELFRELIRAGPVVQMDETPVQVLREPGRENTSKSYMWLARGGPSTSPVCLYHYEQTRGAGYARELLAAYEGYLQADGYQAYEKIAGENERIILVGCWAHARRKFFDAAKASKKTGAAHEGMKKIKELYRVEQELRGEDLDEQEFLSSRREQVEPILTDLKAWLTKKSMYVVPGSLLGKAVGYALKQWDALLRYLDHPDLTPDNNAAENAIRPFVLGRKNWLFNGSPRGAESSCAIYSLIETAKQNGMNPYAYLHYVFTVVPKITESKQWEALLPQNLDPQELDNALYARVREI